MGSQPVQQCLALEVEDADVGHRLRDGDARSASRERFQSPVAGKSSSKTRSPSVRVPVGKRVEPGAEHHHLTEHPGRPRRPRHPLANRCRTATK